jgi:hypothetical protein
MGRKKIEKENRYFVRIDEEGNEIGLYKSKKPRDAAIKAVRVNSYPGDKGVIRLRERGTSVVKVYKFEVTAAPRPEDAPSHLPEKLREVKLQYLGSVRTHSTLPRGLR